jgi:hypothetical protein
MKIPFRTLARLADEDESSWWTTTDKRTFTRTDGDGVTVTIDRLIQVANGFNDPEISRLFPLHQQSRFQPHRAGS